MGHTDIPLTNLMVNGLGSVFNCGADVGSPVTSNYKPPFRFSGKIHGVTVDVSGELFKDDMAIKTLLARQ